MLPGPFPRQKFIVRRRVQIYARTADWNGNRNSSPPGTHLGNLGSKLPVSYFTKNASSVCSLMILLSIFFFLHYSLSQVEISFTPTAKDNTNAHHLHHGLVFRSQSIEITGMLSHSFCVGQQMGPKNKRNYYFNCV